ncbi:hypothetical protein [Zavarzinia compransoris]|uniref:COG3904 family protein n=1 Tax=Zavarzinia compransoris TaxID=1264899 RepID=UPI00106223B8|nr:hypothetical protein [Zavarzinia compransoris]TDP45529.1 hypothetical protein DES42_105236 [Zavarzinia compransoris]
MVKYLLFLVFTIIFSTPAFCAPMKFRIASPNTADGGLPDWIVADGEITSTTADEFRKFIINGGHDRYKWTVLLNSTGGNLIGGVKLGEVIRKFGFGTKVGSSILDNPNSSGFPFEHEGAGVCVSACVFSFIGGVYRIAESNTVGVHQHYIAEALRSPDARLFSSRDFSDQQIISGVLTEYVVRMGVDARILTAAGLTQPQDIYLFSFDEMVKYGITYDSFSYRQWKLDEYKSSLIAVSYRNDEKVKAILFCKGGSLVLSVQKSFFGGNDQEVASAISWVHLFGVLIPDQSVSGRKGKGDTAIYELILPDEILTSKLNLNQGLSGGFRNIMSVKLSGEKFVPYAKLIKKNCA